MKPCLPKLSTPVFASIPYVLLSTLACSTAPLLAKDAPTPQQLAAERKADVQITGHIVKPAELPPPDLSKLKVADGFKIERFAENLGNARILAISPAGHVYVTRRTEADVLMLRVGENGLSNGGAVRVASRPGMHGITFHNDKVYLATVHEIFRADVQKDGSFGPLEMIVHDLPDAGQHHTRTVQFGPDGMMYVSVGSTCNECNETNPENAAMLQLSADGKKRSIYASGLRDTIGWGWHPQSGELWAMDHGMDWLGDDLQPEELNLIQEGHHYGWPYYFADNKVNPHTDPPGLVAKSEWAEICVPMTMGYTAHAAPMQMSFYNAKQFPSEYLGDAFVSMRGSWNRKPPSGYEILRIRFKEGKPQKFEPFVTGFLTEEGQHGRLCGNAIAKDGSLLFTDDQNGVIYRVSHSTPSGNTEVLANLGKTEPPKPVVKPIAIKSPETQTSGILKVSTPAFASNELIPAIHSAYDQNASIPLEWSGAPEGTKSFALFMDDPDADHPKLPVSHWVAWNVPAQATSLREGMENSLRQTDPKGLSQGKNYAGKIGYAGPRPPAGDPPHNYHLQVFALDTVLSLPIGSDRAAVLQALNGHVLAAGEVVGKFQRPEHPAKP